MDEAWSVVEEAEAAEDYSLASKDLLDARLILIQVLHPPSLGQTIQVL